MKKWTPILLPFAMACYFAFNGYQAFQREYSPAQDPTTFFTGLIPWVNLLVAAILLRGAFQEWRHRGRPAPESTPPEPVTRGESVFYRVMAVLVTAIGLIFLVLGGYLTSIQWERVMRWPHTDAVLVSKDVSSYGARLVFSFHVAGQPVTAEGVRYGPKGLLRSSLSSYEPGSIHRINYNPENPADIEPNLDFVGLAWPPFSLLCLVTLFLGGGARIYRWSRG